jgi:hypothetical protein
MAKIVSPDKGKPIDTYRDEKIATEWQKQAFDSIKGIIEEAYPAVKASIKWSQPVWESAEGPMIFLRSASKHLSLGFWRGAEMEDPHGLLEGDGDRMKHIKFKALADVDAEVVRGYVQQAVALNAQKGDPTKGK